MIILQIEITDLIPLDPKRNSPVARNRNAPCPRPVSGQLVDSPAGRAGNLLYTRRAEHRCENASEPVYQIVPQCPVVIVFDEPLQPAMPDGANPHAALYGTTGLLTSPMPEERGRTLT